MGAVTARRHIGRARQLADVLIRALHRAIEKNFAAVHGRISDQETAILALGRLGGREMTATSDLDLIVVYDFDSEHPESAGQRPLYGDNAAFFLAAGAGVRRDVALGAIRSRDVAPTVASVLGLRMDAVEGAVLARMLA